MISKASLVTESANDENQVLSLELEIPADYNFQEFKITVYLATLTDFYELDRTTME